MEAENNTDCKEGQITNEVWLNALQENGWSNGKAYKSLKPDVTNDSARVLGMRQTQKLRQSCIFQSIAHKAYQRMVALLDSKDERVCLYACKEVLDRAWGKPKPTAGIQEDESRKPIPILMTLYGDKDKMPQDTVAKM